jgi:polyisoprenyl-teichoic acid--peptidoglycan teichoic acid transferase
LRRTSSSRAVVLSGIWPGLGQAYLRQPRPAAFLALVPLIPLIPLLLALLGGLDRLLAYPVVPGNDLLLAIAILVGLAFRLLSMALAWRDSAPKRSARIQPALAVFVAAVIGIHAVLTYGAVGLYGVTTRVFSGVVSDVTAPDPSASAGTTGGDIVLPSALPPPQAGERLSFLLIGSDFGTGYTHSLTDTLIVVSVDPATADVVMASIPRDTSRFPMYSGGKFNDKINALMTRAQQDPTKYPDGPLGTLTKEVSFLVGIPIQYVAYINLGGFEKLIDALGGIDVVVAKRIDDTFYQFPNGPKGFHLPAGPAHLDTAHAVAYVRSRYGAGDNDFTRARRQQQVLIAIKDKLTDPATLPKLPHILDVVSRLISTNFPPDQVSQMIDLSHQVTPDSISQFVLGPPYAIRPAGSGEYMLVPDMDRYAKWSIKYFGIASRYNATASTP